MKKIILIAITLAPYLCYSQIADSAQREIKLTGAVNFRDLGGYSTKDGKQVKWGKLYRSASIGKLTNEDVRKLDSLSIGYVVDFRGPKEVAAAPDRLPSNATYVQLQAGSENTGDTANMRKMIESMNDSGLLKYYTDLTPFKARYQPLFDQLLYTSPDSFPHFTLTPKLRVFAELNNLTNEPLRTYIGDKRRVAMTEWYGSRGQAGIRWDIIK